MLIAVRIMHVNAVTPDPLYVSYSTGKEIYTPQQSYGGCIFSYLQHPDNSTLDTVMCFTRKAGTNTYFGPRYGLKDDKTGNGLNDNRGIPIGGKVAEQYRYLVVNAKLSTSTPFIISLKFAVNDEGEKPSKTNDIASLNAPVVNKWASYVFDLSQAGGTQGGGKSYLSLLITPERSQDKPKTETVSYINEVYFTNTISAGMLLTMKPTITTIARAAKTVDLVWSALPGAKSYNILDKSNKVILSNVVKTHVSIENLKPATEYTFRLEAQNESGKSLVSDPVSILSRSVVKKDELIENFEGDVSLWVSQMGAKINASVVNPAVSKQNSTAKCAQVLIAAGKENYCGIKNQNEIIVTGPDAPYQYLHVKMKRNADNGGFALTLLERKDLKQKNNSPTILLPFEEKMVDGNWNDYVFDLKAATSENQTHYGFYLRPNRTFDKTQADTESFIDEITLSNQ